MPNRDTRDEQEVLQVPVVAGCQGDTGTVARGENGVLGQVARRLVQPVLATRVALPWAHGESEHCGQRLALVDREGLLDFVRGLEHEADAEFLREPNGVADVGGFLRGDPEHQACRRRRP